MTRAANRTLLKKHVDIGEVYDSNYAYGVTSTQSRVTGCG